MLFIPFKYTVRSDESRQTIELVCKLALDWCLKIWGTPDYRSKPILTCNWDGGEKWVLGYQRGLHTTINLHKHHSILQVINTVIHEFTHYRQNSGHRYRILNDKFGYYNNPMEIEARIVANRFKKLCYKEVRKEFKN